jgi:hypothetical protein
MTFLDRSDLVGHHPQPLRYYLTLGLGTLRTAVDLAMLVLGTGLMGLAVAVLLDGFDVIDAGLGLGIGATLGSALVLGVCGGFALGIASEGRYGMSRSLDGFPSLEVVLGRLIGIVVMAIFLLWAAGRLEPLIVDLPYPLVVGVAVMRSVGASGFVAGLVGAPAAWGVRRGLDRLDWGTRLEMPTLYVIWLIAAIVVFDLP